MEDEARKIVAAMKAASQEGASIVSGSVVATSVAIAVATRFCEEARANHTPTQFAYDAVCAARTKWQERAEAAERRVAKLEAQSQFCTKHADCILRPDPDDPTKSYCPVCEYGLQEVIARLQADRGAKGE